MDSLSLNAPDALVCAPTEKCRVPPMPIRFRCAYCNQLMGIARRKAGTIVRCPKCAGEVIVPALPEPQAANGPGRLDRQLLEADDFGKDFADLDSVPEALPNSLLPPPAYG